MLPINFLNILVKTTWLYDSRGCKDTVH